MTDTQHRQVELTIRDLCHQWEVVQAKLNLDLLENKDGDEGSDRILNTAREQFRAIEEAILGADPDTLRDVDLVSMLRFARNVIGDDQFIPEQEARCEGMLDLIEGTLVRRTEPADWNREGQS